MSGSTSDSGGKPARGAARSRSKRAKRGAVSDAIADAAKILGGAEGLAEWVRADTKNQEKFWTTLYPKLIPLQKDEEATAPVSIAAAIEAARKRAIEATKAADEEDAA